MATKTATGGTPPCPCCGEAHGDEAFTCQECDAIFGREILKLIMRRWTKVLAWVDLMPTSGGERALSSEGE